MSYCLSRNSHLLGVQLVVPTGIHDAYPNSVRPHLVSFESFIGDIRLLNIGGGDD